MKYSHSTSSLCTVVGSSVWKRAMPCSWFTGFTPADWHPKKPLPLAVGEYLICLSTQPGTHQRIHGARNGFPVFQKPQLEHVTAQLVGQKVLGQLVNSALHSLPFSLFMHYWLNLDGIPSRNATFFRGPFMPRPPSRA